MSSSSGALRRLILGAAVVLAFSVWSASKAPPANAQETRPPASPAAPAPPAPSPVPALPSAPADAATAAPAADRKPAFAITIEAKDGADAAKAAPGAADKDGTPAERTVTVKKGDKTITVTGIPGDKEFDSFDELVRTEPAFAGMIVGIVAIVFFAPVLAIALVIGYRMRKARMQNETMLKLAERGIVTSPEAMAAVAGGPVAGAVAAGATVRDLRARAAWSDLRKGVVMGAIGLALIIYYALRHGTPNVVGLVLLFLGIGYGALWWFEQRQIGPAGAGTGRRPGTGPADAGNGA